MINNIRSYIGNDFIFYLLIILFVIIAINVFSKFVNNLYLLIINFRLFVNFIYKLFIQFIKFLIKFILFPITIYNWIKEYKFYNQFIINASRGKYD